MYIGNGSCKSVPGILAHQPTASHTTSTLSCPQQPVAAPGTVSLSPQRRKNKRDKLYQIMCGRQQREREPDRAPLHVHRRPCNALPTSERKCTRKDHALIRISPYAATQGGKADRMACCEPSWHHKPTLPAALRGRRPIDMHTCWGSCPVEPARCPGHEPQAHPHPRPSQCRPLHHHRLQ